jgi:hypothetical protein
MGGATNEVFISIFAPTKFRLAFGDRLLAHSRLLSTTAASASSGSLSRSTTPMAASATSSRLRVMARPVRGRASGGGVAKLDKKDGGGGKAGASGRVTLWPRTGVAPMSVELLHGARELACSPVSPQLERLVVVNDVAGSLVGELCRA